MHVNWCCYQLRSYTILLVKSRCRISLKVWCSILPILCSLGNVSIKMPLLSIECYELPLWISSTKSLSKCSYVPLVNLLRPNISKTKVLIFSSSCVPKVRMHLFGQRKLCLWIFIPWLEVYLYFAKDVYFSYIAGCLHCYHW